MHEPTIQCQRLAANLEAAKAKLQMYAEVKENWAQVSAGDLPDSGYNAR